MRHVLMTAFLTAAGCGFVCPPASKCLSDGAIVIRVFDADTQAALPRAVVLASSGGPEVEVSPCRYDLGAAGDAGPEGTNCRAITSAGKYHLKVRADGYAEAALEVEASPDLCGDVYSQKREVALQKLGSSQQALVTPAVGCGG